MSADKRIILVLVLSACLLLPIQALASSEAGIDVYHGTAGIVSGPSAPVLSSADYGSAGPVEGRILLWIVIQQHFFLGSLLLGLPMLAVLFEAYGMVSRRRGRPIADEADAMGKEVMEVGLPFIPLTAALGVILVGAFLLLYRGFFLYMSALFRPVVYAYILSFLAEIGLLYLYTLSWRGTAEGPFPKWLHLSVGVVANANGVLIVYLANTWMAFMMSPAGVDAKGRYLGDLWKAIHTPLWHPLNVHRILASLMFAGGIIAAYSAYRFLRARTAEERAHYDRLGYVTLSLAAFGLFLLPFAGYWFAKVIFIYRQRMGMTLMGGLLTWPFVVQAFLITLIFMGIAYYLWQGMSRMEGSQRYAPAVKYLLIVLGIASLIWSTPHTLPGTPQEFKAMGGTQHPVVGNYGTMAAKNTAINTIIVVIGLCFMIYQRANKTFDPRRARRGNLFLIALFLGGEANILALGIYSYFVPAAVRVGLALPQFCTALTTLVGGGAINYLMMRGAEARPIRWGEISKRGICTLFFLALFITITMVHMGYIRSTVRLNWHITEIMQDNSPWAATPSLGYALSIVGLNVAIFWSILGLTFWLKMAVRERERARSSTPLASRETSVSPRP